MDDTGRTPEHVHQLDLCPDCDGLRTTLLTRLPGVVDVRLDHIGGTGFSFTGPAVIHIGPAPGPCPNPRPEEM